MKIKGEEIYTLAGIYSKIFQTVEFDSYIEARNFAKAAKSFEEEVAVVNELKDKVVSKYSKGKDKKNQEEKNKDIALLNRELTEFFQTEFDVENVIKIKEKYAEKVIRSAFEAGLLSKLELVIENEG